MSEKSVVLIGAGSTVFTPGLMTDLASSPAFGGWTVHLVDLDADAADTMARLGRRIATVSAGSGSARGASIPARLI